MQWPYESFLYISIGVILGAGGGGRGAEGAQAPSLSSFVHAWLCKYTYLNLRLCKYSFIFKNLYPETLSRIRQN